MISGIVLAAGMSQRMGTPKALLDWGGETLVAYQVRQLREAGCSEVIVVLGHVSDAIQRRMHDVDCRVMFNARHQFGRAGSLRIGAKAASRDADAIVILNVDQPRPAATIRALLEAHRPEAAATRPVHNGRHGHPVVVAGRLREELMGAQDASGGLHGVLARHEGEIDDVACDAVCNLDVNTPEDYEAARRTFGLVS
ncbi:MAG: nucleotidyltransferase family protein [Tepidiformaceae bacterium]